MSFAIIKTGGKQYKVAEGDKILVEKLAQPVGDEFDFSEVLLVANGSADSINSPQAVRQGSPQASSPQVAAENLKIGQPLIMGAKVRAKVLEQGKADKKIVFKYHSKTRYKKKKGHRQPFTKVEILKITA